MEFSLRADLLSEKDASLELRLSMKCKKGYTFNKVPYAKISKDIFCNHSFGMDAIVNQEL